MLWKEGLKEFPSIPLLLPLGSTGPQRRQEWHKRGSRLQPAPFCTPGRFGQLSEIEGLCVPSGSVQLHSVVLCVSICNFYSGEISLDFGRWFLLAGHSSQFLLKGFLAATFVRSLHILSIGFRSGYCDSLLLNNVLYFISEVYMCFDLSIRSVS